MHQPSIVATALALLALALAAGADTRLSIRSNQSGKESETHSVMVADGKVRMEAQNTILLYHQQTNTFLAVQPEQKSYMELDPESTGAMMDQVSQMREQMMAQLKEQLAEMPEAQREQMMEMMKRSGQPLPNVEPEELRYETDVGSDRVSGIACSWAHAHEGDTKVRELCLAQPGAMGFASHDEATMRAMQQSMKAMSERMGGAGAGFFRDDMPDGFPIHVRHLDASGALEMEQIVESISDESIDPGLFEVPEGYRKQELPQMSR